LITYCCYDARALLTYLILFMIIQLTVVYSVLPLIWSVLLLSTNTTLDIFI